MLFYLEACNAFVDMCKLNLISIHVCNRVLQGHACCNIEQSNVDQSYFPIEALWDILLHFNTM